MSIKRVIIRSHIIPKSKYLTKKEQIHGIKVIYGKEVIPTYSGKDKAFYI